MRLATRAVRLFVAAFALLLVSIASPAIASPQAATTAVNAAFVSGFTPGVVNIGVGDSIKWTNTDGAPHTTTANGGQWDGSLTTQGSTFTFVFNVAGAFSYRCKIHANMVGTINVAAVATSTPTPQPTVAPTPVPTVRTAQPTPTPTVAPTAQATVATTAPATQPPATTAAATAPATSTVPATTAPVAVASPATTASATPPSDAGGPGPLIIGGAVAIVVGLGALAWVLLRR